MKDLKPVIDLISFDFGYIAHLVVIILTVSSALVFVLEVIISLLSKKQRDTVYYLCYSLLSLVVTLYFQIEDYFGEKLLFETPKSVYAFMTLLISLSIIFYTVIRSLSNMKTCKNRVEKSSIFSETPSEIKVSTITPKPYNYTSNANVSDGYLDVSHVKGLINNLKEKPLSDSDYREIEDLELYLMNFISRQPSDSERAVLSEKLSMLIKKIALYAS